VTEQEREVVSDWSVLVGTEDGLHRVESAPVGGNGSRWNHRTEETPEGRVDALAGDRWGTYALVAGRSLWRGVLPQDARTAPERWVEVASIEGPPGRCLLATEEGLFVGTAEAGLLRYVDGELLPVKGFMEVEGRGGWYTPWGGPPDTRSMARDGGGRLHVNVHVGGIVRSTDGGETWHPTIDVDADVHQVVADPARPDVVLAAGARGLSISGDGGDTWDLSTEGLHGAYCRAVARSGSDVLVSASTGPFTDRAAVYRRAIDGDEPFEKCGAGLPEWFPSNVDSHCLVAVGPAAALGTAEGEVYRSADGGGTWERAAGGLPGVRCLLMT
jgi:hypothetical protein